MKTLNFKTEFIGLLIMIRTRSRTHKVQMKSFMGISAYLAASKMITGKILVDKKNMKDLLDMIIDLHRDNHKATYNIYGRSILLHTINLNFWMNWKSSQGLFKKLLDLQFQEFRASLRYNFTPWYQFSQRKAFKTQLEAVQLEIKKIDFT